MFYSDVEPKKHNIDLKHAQLYLFIHIIQFHLPILQYTRYAIQ